MIEQENNMYPRNDINPADKTAEWGLLYCKAAWQDWSYTTPRTVFYNAADKYEEARMYAIGKQPINKYKKLLGVDEVTNNTWINVDWSVRPIIPKFRDIVVSKLCLQEYGVVATPIDPQAKSELDKYYTEMKAKIQVRDLMQQQSPELAQHPLLKAQPGEPYDMEELEMRVTFGEQFNRSKDAEQAIQLAFYENNARELRRKFFEQEFDCGVTGYKDWLGDDGRPKFRNINPESVITNYCRHADFRDLVHAGEVIDWSVVDLAALKKEDGEAMFTDDELTEIVNCAAGKWGNPTIVGRSTNYFRGYDKFKVKVLDMQWFSYNDYNYESNVNRRGNVEFNQAAYNKRNNVKNKYTRKRIKVVYECKWIIGTDFTFDFRLQKNMKRSPDAKKMAETTLNYKFYAPNFYEMRALSMMDRLMPLADDYQLTVYKIQNFKNRMVPNGWWIDLDGLENVALNKGGENMTPKQLLDMFFETGILVGRSKDIMGDNVNYKPIIPIENTMASELIGLYNDLNMTLQQMQSICGLNELTDGSTPNPKMLNGVAEIAVNSTNNALYPLQFGERVLVEQLASDMVIRTQQAVKQGNFEGFAPALNNNALIFMQFSSDYPLRTYGIMLEERPTDDQRQIMMMQMQNDIAQGFLDSSDVLYIMNVFNVKQAQQMLAYKVKKNKQAQALQQIQMNQQTIEGQQKSAQMAEAAKQQTIQVQLQADLMKIQAQGEIDMQKQQLISETALKTAQINGEAKIGATVLTNDSKEKQVEKQAEKATSVTD